MVFAMQIKKIIAFAAASVIALSTAAFTAFADGSATFCFDTDTSLSMWQGYGSTAETGFTASIDEQTRSSGNGSLKLSENVTESIAADARMGGLYVEAEALGLENLDGCTVSMKVMIDQNAAKLMSAFSVFSDGIVWISSDVAPADASGKWTDVVLNVPQNASNTRFGFEIPIYEAYSGPVAYIDDLTVYDANGNAIANIGDEKASTHIDVSIGTAPRIILIVVVCVILVAVVVGIGFIVNKFNNKFTQ